VEDGGAYTDGDGVDDFVCVEPLFNEVDFEDANVAAVHSLNV